MASKNKESPKQNTQAEKDLKTQFANDLKESKAFMDPIQQRMDKDYEVYRNYRYVDDCEFKISDFYAYVETVVPIVTNNRIRAHVVSDYPDYTVHATGLNDILDNTYDINNWDYMSQELMRMALIQRSSFAYTGFDKKYKNDTGKLCIDVVNARWCWTDPAACHLDKDSRFFFYVEPMRKSQVLSMHPDIKSELNNANASMGPWTTSNTGTGSTWFKTWLASVKNFLIFNNNATQARQTERYTTLPELDEQDKYKNVIAYIHYWYRDDDDCWRVSHWADDILCDDMENPFYHGRLPYDILSPIKDIFSAWGIPVNEQMEEMNVQRNLLMQYYINNAQLHGNPPLLYNTTMGNVRDPEKLKEQATGTGVIPVNNPDMVPLQAIADYMNVPVMPGSATSLFDHLGAIMDNISGINDSFRGTAQASSGKEVQLQQEAAYTRIKTMIDQFELFNKSIAEKIISNAMQFYTQTRAFRVKGDYTKYDDVKKLQEYQGNEMPFDIKPIPQGMDAETGEPVMSKSEFFMYANPNEWTKLKPDMESDTDGEEQTELEEDDSYGETKGTGTDRSNISKKRKESDEEKAVDKAYKILQMTVEIEAGSSLPQSRIARREEAAELFKAGAIDQEALLEAYDYPGKDKIMKRMAENAQRMQQAQAQAAQAEEQAKAQSQMQIEQMKIQAEMQKTQMTNESKLQQQQMSNQGQIAEQSMQNSGNDIAGILQKVREAAPETQAFSDEEILKLLAQG